MTTATPFTVAGKTALITGAGSGICFAFAELLVSKGCNVAIVDIALRPEAEALVNNHTKSPRVVFFKTDVADWTQLSAAFDRTLAEFGDLDIVCPGAGVFEPLRSNFWQPPGASAHSQDDPNGMIGHYKTLDINVTHPIRVTQLAIAEFLNPSKGAAKVSSTNPKRIVHLCSTGSEVAFLATPIYIASKWAISGFVRSLAHLESEFAIRVNAVAPGIVLTPLWTESPDKMSMVGPSNEKSLSTQDVAEELLRLVESAEMAGGTVLEVTTAGSRVIPLFGNEGPPLKRSPSVYSQIQGEIVESLKRPGWGKSEGS